MLVVTGYAHRDVPCSLALGVSVYAPMLQQGWKTWAVDTNEKKL